VRYIALLRAINVGGHTVKMDHLRGLFAALGYTDVETFIASGNVIFDSKRRDARKIESEIENHLHDSLGYEVSTMVRTPAEVLAVSKHATVGAMNGRSLYVGFMASEPPKDGIKAAEALTSDASELKVDGREIYWLVKGNLLDSGLNNGVIEKKLKTPVTFRNITTVTKIAAKYC
jgi:uncharacterized protein (DUF1697 family)